jgi:hypothetical protein
VNLFLRRDQIVVRREERVLDRVLGLLWIAEHVPAERQDAAMMAVVDHLEGRTPALPDQ